MTSMELAISALFTIYTGGVATVIKALWAENRRLTAKLDDSNESSRELITVLVKVLEGGGVKVVPVKGKD